MPEAGLVDAQCSDGRRRVPAADDGEARGIRHGVGDRARAVREGRDLEYAHRSVPHDGPGIGERMRVSACRIGSDIEALPARRDLADADDPDLRLGGEFLGDDHVDRQEDLHAEVPCALHDVAHGRHEILFEERVAYGEALRPEERECHASAHQDAVDALEEMPDDGKLVGNLRTAKDDRVRPLRIVEDPGETRELGLHQRARGTGHQSGNVRHRRLLPVHDPEAVTDVGSGPRRPLLCQCGALGGILARLPGIEPDVLQEGDVSIAQGRDGSRHGIPRDRGNETHRGAQQVAQPGGNRCEGQRRVSHSTRAAQVGDHDDPRAALTQRLDRRHARANAPVVGDHDPLPVPRQRNVQVAADEDHASRDIESGEAIAHRRAPTYCVRSIRRLE